MNNKKIGKFIQNLRLELNMTQKDLAENYILPIKQLVNGKQECYCANEI